MRRTLVALLAAILAAGAAGARRPLPERLLEATEAGRLDRSLIAEAIERGGRESRLLAARLLASVGSPEGARQVALLARDPDPRVRRMALLAAGRLGRPATGIVARAVHDPDPEVRAAAVWAALQLDPVPEALARPLAGESAPDVLAVAAAGIALVPEAVRRTVVERVEAVGGAALERALALGLGRRGLDHPRLRRLASARDPWTRAAAVAGLGRGEAEPGDRAIVTAALDDPEEAVRTAAAAALAARPAWRLDGGEAAALVAALDPRSPQLAVAAIRALGAHPEAADAGALVRLADGPFRWLAAEALAALARRGWPGAAARVASWLEAPERWRREAAACAAAALPGGAALGNRALADPEPAVRLAWLEHAPRGAVPQAALSTILARDPDPAVRAAALERQMREIEVSGERLLAYYRAWRGDRLGEARATALLAALRRAPRRRRALVAMGTEDPDPAVQARVAWWAWRHGLEAPPPRRVAREREAYAELLRWMREPQWVDLVTDRGTVRLRLEPERAPITARRFWERAASHRYDGTIFHRVVPGFVVQGGDPRGDGWGSGGLVLPDEPDLAPFAPGAVGIATSGPGTGGCQLFAMLGPAPHLVGRYTRFARVVRGADVLARLQRWDRIRKVRVASGPEPPPPVPVRVGAIAPAQALAVPGWREVYAAYEPDPEAVGRLAASGVRLRLVAVLGTWCSDSRREIPRLLKVLDALPAGRAAVRLWAVDRTLTVADPAFPVDVLPGRRVERVPTVVVRDADGIELGRVVETAELPWEELLAGLVEMTGGGDGG